MDKYIAELHREMEALRDTVILLQNDNAELVVERNHVRDLGAQQLRAQQQQVKEQEILFLNHLKSRDLEIERLRVETNQLTAEKEKLNGFFSKVRHAFLPTRKISLNGQNAKP